MKIDLIINTAALDPAIRNHTNPFRNRRYGERAEILEDTLTRVQGFDMVYAVGVYKPGEDYEYLHMPPKFRDRRDALWQRDLGARNSVADILVFCHDDHAPDDDFADTLRSAYEVDFDILVPKRIHKLTGEELNNGGPRFEDHPYMGGHCFVMSRAAWAEVPFTTVDTEFWDTSLSRIWTAAGLEIRHVDNLTHFDLEAYEHES